MRNRSVPTDTVLPHIMYRDLAEALVWLSRTFEFTEHYRYGDERGQPSGAQMHLGDTWIMLKGARAATPRELGYGTQSLTVFVEDVDAHFERTRSAGANIVEALHETIYGERQYGVEDLDGHLWLFSQHARDVSPNEWGATVMEAVFEERAEAGSTTPSGPLRQTGRVGDRQARIQCQLSVRRGREAVEFYKAAFGAVELYRFGGTDDHEEVVAQLAVGGAEFWVEDESPTHKNFSPQSLGGSTERMLLIVDDPEAVIGRAITAGAREIYPVTGEHGWRLGRVEDPFGHHWEIGKPVTDWPPED